MISIIIPAYNEEKRIGKTLDTIILFAEKNLPAFEILVVDDGSTDKTIEIANQRKVKTVKNPKNMGKGASVKTGMLMAEGEYLLFSDADLSTPIEETMKFLEYIEDYDVVFGSRNLPESNITVTQPLYRRVMGKIFPFLVNCLVLRGIKDTQCGFKMFKRESAKRLFSKQTLSGFGFDVEILYLAKKNGHSVLELPVSWKNDPSSKVHPIRDSFRMLLDLMKIRKNIIRRRY